MGKEINAGPISHVELIAEYANIINQFGNNSNSLAWSGTFLANKDRFHSPFFHEFIKLSRGNHSYTPQMKFTSFFKTLLKRFLFLFFHMLKSVIYVLYARLIFHKKKKERAKSISHGATSLIKSFCFDRSFSNGKFQDEFFGDLTEFLKTQKIDIVTIVDPLNSPFSAIKKLLEADNTFPFYAYNSLSDFFKIILVLVKGFLQTPSGKPTLNGINLKRFMAQQYLLDLLNPILFQGLIMGYAFQRITKDLKPQKLYLTYENLNWERPMLKLFRAASPRVQVIGFQHAIIAKACTNYFIGKDEDRSGIPDKIVTNGLVNKNILMKYGYYDDIEIRVGAALRQKYIFNLKLQSRQTKKVLLIALEGTTQTAEFANHVFKFIDQLKDWRIILRTHPILPIENLNSHFSIDIQKFPNIEISNGQSIQEDIERSFAVIYWGTTISLESLALGKPVIHYDRGDLLSYDPIFEFNDTFKQNTNRNDNLALRLNTLFNLDTNAYESGKRLALEYVKKYFYPVTEENLKNFIF